MPSHSSPPSRENDDFARRLEAIHQRIVTSSSAPENIDGGENDPTVSTELQSAASLFRLIEQVRIAGSHETVGLFSADTAVEPANEFAIDQPLPRAESSSGQRLGKFTIESKLGEGGYGYVFLAIDEELDRRVALKVPRPEAILTEEMRFRFMREGKAAALLSHPHIVPVFETGHDGPICFIVSRYVDGMTLADWLVDAPDHRIDPRQAALVTANIAAGLQHAHARGVIHRDLKPANILLEGFRRRAPQPGEKSVESLDQAARITDFGLAKTMGEDHALTGTGAVIGTPAYMSPEQARGVSVIAGSDVYSLGAILYEMLTGSPPHTGASILETLRSVHEREPLGPRKRNAAVPKDLDAICMKCLAKEPTRRYRFAQELQDDLQRYLEGQPIRARSTTWLERALAMVST